MTKYSNVLKTPGQHTRGLREHWKRQRTDKRYSEKRNSAVNDCFRPSAEASKADLIEYHREEMGLRRSHRRARTATVRIVPTGSIATGNRHGGEHEHKREITRRAGRCLASS